MGERKSKSNKGKQPESESIPANRVVLSACVCDVLNIPFGDEVKRTAVAFKTGIYNRLSPAKRNPTNTSARTVNVGECIKNGEMRLSHPTPKEMPWRTRNTAFSYHMYRIVLLHHFDIVFFSMIFAI